MIYLISYDLHRTKNYPVLHKTISDIGNCTKPLESLWLVESPLALLEINNIIKNAVDSDDCYYVVPIKEPGVGKLLSTDAWNWIRSKFGLAPSSMTLRLPAEK